MSWKRVVIVGMSLGVVLGGGAYGVLSIADSELAANDRAVLMERAYTGTPVELYEVLTSPGLVVTYHVAESLPVELENASQSNASEPLPVSDSDDVPFNGEHHSEQPAAGYRYVAPDVVENDSGDVQGGEAPVQPVQEPKPQPTTTQPEVRTIPRNEVEQPTDTNTGGNHTQVNI